MRAEIADSGLGVMQLSREGSFKGMPVVNGRDGKPCRQKLLEKLVRSEGLRQIAPVAVHPSASVNPHHERGRGRGCGHPDVKLQRSISPLGGVSDALVSLAAIGLDVRIG